MIHPPRLSHGDPKRAAECQAALDAEYLRLLAEAMEAGWSYAEASRAIVALARSYRAAIKAAMTAAKEMH